MKKIIALGMLASLLNAGLLHAQEAAPAATTASAVAPTAAATDTTAVADTNAVVDTNVVAAAELKPPEDPVKNMITRFSFDAGLAPDPTSSGFSVPMTFQRESSAFLNGQTLGPNMPRLVAGKFGKGLLMESVYANLYSPSQAGAEEASMFQPLPGSALTGNSEQPFEGKQALSVTTKGEASEEGSP